MENEKEKRLAERLPFAFTQGERRKNAEDAESWD
jgi:hypothetical protein